LNLVYNPVGAFLPPRKQQSKRIFARIESALRHFVQQSVHDYEYADCALSRLAAAQRQRRRVYAKARRRF
jgi:hypothetical protein